MPRPYSLDLRERVFMAVTDGLSVRSVARHFNVSPSFVSKLCKRHRESQTLVPRPQGGDRWSHLIEAHANWLLDEVQAKPDITLEEVRLGLAARGLKTSTTAVHNFFCRHDLSFKKRQHMQQSRNEKMSPQLAQSGATCRKT